MPDLTSLNMVFPPVTAVCPTDFNIVPAKFLAPLRAAPPTLNVVSTTADFLRSLSTPPFTTSNPFFKNLSLLVSLRPSLGSASAAMFPKSLPFLSVTCHVPSLF